MGNISNTANYFNTTLPLTYKDISCDLDVDPFGRDTTSDLQNFIQDVFHLLIESPGSNPDDPTRGIGVDLYLSGTGDQLATLPGLIDSQVGGDPRCSSCKSTLEQKPDGTFTLTILVQVSGTVLPLTFDYTSQTGLIYRTTIV